MNSSRLFQARASALLLTCLMTVLFMGCTGSKNVGEAGTEIGNSDNGKSDRGSDIDLDGGLDPKPAKVTISPDHTMFWLNVDQNWASLDFMIENTGELPTGPLAMAVTGSSAADFTLHRENCREGIDPGRRCSIFLFYQGSAISPDPTHGTEVTAFLTITDSESVGSTITVPITLIILVSSEGLVLIGPPDMGTVGLNTSSASLSFMVMNIGEGDSGSLQVSSSSPQFGLGLDSCSGNFLAIGDTCNFYLQFSPMSLGLQWTVLTVQGSAGMIASEVMSGMCR
jgi:hypothetical protein